MIKSEIEDLNINEKKEIAIDTLGDEFNQYLRKDSDVIKFNYQIEGEIEINSRLKLSENIQDNRPENNQRNSLIELR